MEALGPARDRCYRRGPEFCGCVAGPSCQLDACTRRRRRDASEAGRGGRRGAGHRRVRPEQTARVATRRAYQLSASSRLQDPSWFRAPACTRARADRHATSGTSSPSSWAGSPLAGSPGGPCQRGLDRCCASRMPGLVPTALLAAAAVTALVLCARAWRLVPRRRPRGAAGASRSCWRPASHGRRSFA